MYKYIHIHVHVHISVNYIYMYTCTYIIMMYVILYICHVRPSRFTDRNCTRTLMRAVKPGWREGPFSTRSGVEKSICVLILLDLSSCYYRCPHTYNHVFSYYYKCPHTTVYVSYATIYVPSYYYVRVRMTISVLRLLYVCPHSAMCVLIVLHMWFTHAGISLERLTNLMWLVRRMNRCDWIPMHVAYEAWPMPHTRVWF
jgi:hypothetical protein